MVLAIISKTAINKNTRLYIIGCKIGCLFYKTLIFNVYCGERGIRTPGASQLNGFQDRRNRPLCHLSGHKNSTVFPFRQISGAIISLQLSPERHPARQFCGPGFRFRAKSPIFAQSDRYRTAARARVPNKGRGTAHSPTVGRSG